MQTLTLSIPNKYDHVGLISRCVAMLVGDKLGEDTGILESAMGEALNNVIEHSYPNDTQDTVDVKLHFEQDKIVLQIQDHGRGMDPIDFRQAPAELDFDSTDVQALPEGGMGLCIIKMVADDVDYVRDGRINRLTMKFSENSPIRRQVRKSGNRVAAP